jgi:single-strand DNA-binding protein
MSAPITLNGRLGADPEFKISASGVALCNLRIVTNGRKLNDATQQWEDVDTTWWAVTAFKATAEVAAQLTKGQRVIVIGKVRERQWETPAGEKRSRHEVVADEVAAIPRPESAPKPAAPADDPWSNEAPF